MLVEVHSAFNDSDVSRIVNRKRYSDIGAYQGLYQNRVDVINACRNMIQDLKEYSDRLAKCSSFGIKHTIMVDIDKAMMFYVDKVYFRLVINGVSCDICVKLKESIMYRVILNQLGMGAKPYLLADYSRSWRGLYRCVVLEDSRLCGWGEYLLGGSGWILI